MAVDIVAVLYTHFCFEEICRVTQVIDATWDIQLIRIILALPRNQNNIKRLPLNLNLLAADEPLNEIQGAVLALLNPEIFQDPVVPDEAVISLGALLLKPRSNGINSLTQRIVKARLLQVHFESVGVPLLQ